MFLKKFSLWWLPVLIASILLNVVLVSGSYSTSPGVKVLGVIDGDTLVLDGKSRVRLRYVDAPELEFCGGEQAKAYLEKLVAGKRVRIEDQIPDQYGRGMALVYVGNDLINKDMLSSGWGRYHNDNTQKTEELKNATALAKQEKRGIYSKCQSQDSPDKPGCLIKGNVDKNSDARTYYLPTCAQYKFTIVEKDIGENWFCTEKEAITAGFKKAATCK